MAFTDVYYSGEHEQYEDLTKFRARWQGKQWGIWPILLGDDSHSYRPLHLTYCLLHGVSVWPAGFLGRNDMLRQDGQSVACLRPLRLSALGVDSLLSAQTGLARSDNPNVKVSLYLQRQKHHSAGCREPGARSGQLYVEGRPESDGAPRHIGLERSG